MTQPGGIGTKVVWKDPADYAETMLGFRRYFTLENRICKELFKLANNLPAHWRNCGTIVRREKRTEGGKVVPYAYVAMISLEKGVEVNRVVAHTRRVLEGIEVKVVRRDRVQTAGGAVSQRSYGAAFSMQAANMRAAANHEIQVAGCRDHKARSAEDLGLAAGRGERLARRPHEHPRRDHVRHPAGHGFERHAGGPRVRRALPPLRAADRHGLERRDGQLGREEERPRSQDSRTGDDEVKYVDRYEIEYRRDDGPWERVAEVYPKYRWRTVRVWLLLGLICRAKIVNNAEAAALRARCEATEIALGLING